MLEAKIPDGPLENKWSHYRSTAKLVSPGNRRKLLHIARMNWEFNRALVSTG
jgi:hypothetical protein